MMRRLIVMNKNQITDKEVIVTKRNIVIGGAVVSVASLANGGYFLIHH
jgi:hypothetical protein